MNCPEIERLAAWVDGTLLPKERASLASHLVRCDDCRRAIALAGEALESPAEPLSPHTADRWLRKVRRPRALLWSYAAAAVLLVAGVVFFLVPSSPPPIQDRARGEGTREIVGVSKLRDDAVLEPSNPPYCESPERERAEPPAEECDSVLAIDGSGDLWVRGSRAGGTFRSDGTIESREAPAAFTVEGRMTVALEKETAVRLGRSRRQKDYVLEFEKGAAFLDTEGARQPWQFLAGTIQLFVPEVQGRILVQSLAEALQVHVLQGKIQVAFEGKRQEVENGRSITLGSAGRISTDLEDLWVQRKQLTRLGEIRPQVRTAFLATFDESRPFDYEVLLGTNTGASLLAERPSGSIVSRVGAAVERGVGLRLGQDVCYLNGMMLRFQYRASASCLYIQAGKYSGRVTVHASPGKWTTVEVPIEMLQEEGVPVDIGDPIRDLFISLLKSEEAQGPLEVDSIELRRNARYAR